MSLTVEISNTEDGLTFVLLKGEVDHHTYEILESELEEVIENGAIKIAIDLTNVNYISSAGIGVLVGAQSEAESAEGGALVLFGLKKEVESVFESMGFTSVFKVAKSKDDAVAMVKGGA